MFKVNKRDTMFNVNSKDTRTMPRRSAVFIVKFEHISHIVLVFL